MTGTGSGRVGSAAQRRIVAVGGGAAHVASRASRTGSHLARLAVFLGAAATVALSASSAYARPSAVMSRIIRRPDYIITSISVHGLPGSPNYIVLEPNRGEAPGFTVKVTTMNVGNAAATAKSHTALIFVSGGKVVAQRLEPVPALSRKGKHISTFVVDNLRPPLGLLRVSAEADSSNAVKELDNGNNSKPWLNASRPWMPVIPQQWTVNDLMLTNAIGGSGSMAGGLPGSLETAATKAQSGFLFRFSSFDRPGERFVYIPDGTLRTTVDFSYVQPPSLSCSGHGGNEIPNGHWPGHVWVNMDLQSYDALVEGSKVDTEHQTEVYCNGMPLLPLQWTAMDVGTAAEAPMEPSETKLHGHIEKPGPEPGSTFTYQWTFTAKVPVPPR